MRITIFKLRITAKVNFRTHIRQYTYPNKNFEFSSGEVYRRIWHYLLAILNFHLGRYIVGYTFGNHVLRLHLCVAVKIIFRQYIQRYTSPNENFEYSFPLNHLTEDKSYEPVHEVSNNVVCATSKASDQPAHTRSLIRAFASRLSIL